MQANLTLGLAAPRACFYYYFLPSDKLAADSAATPLSLSLQSTTGYRSPKELIQAEDKKQNSALEPGFPPCL